MPRITPGTRYLVRFAMARRAGRIPDLEIPRWMIADRTDLIPNVIYRHVRTHYGDPDIAVTVDTETWTGELDLGRYGTFTITDLDAPEQP